MRDLIVLSDFHLGRGKNRETGRYWALEAFFYDQDLLGFVQWLIAQPHAVADPPLVIFNGDTFDLLRVEPEDDAQGHAHPPDYLTPTSAARILAQILDGHPTFVQAVATALCADLPVLFLPGNHDIELQWPIVQAVVRDAVALAVDGLGQPGQATTERLLKFHPWFYHEPGRAWIEHGCQYDPENAFAWHLRGALDDVSAEDTEVDQPLGNFFQRYLYNSFGPITFMVPSSRANLRYGRWLLLNNPKVLIRAATKQLPFAIRWLRRLALKKLLPPATLPDVHQKELHELAEQSGLGESLLRIEELKELRGDVVTTVELLARNLVRALGIAVVASMALAGLWFLGIAVIQNSSHGYASQTAWFMALTLCFAAAMTGGATLLLLRDSPKPEPSPLPQAAGRVAALLQVPLVVFGHTHDEAVNRLPDTATPSWYYNTGTWIAVFTHDVLLPRDTVQYTFLRIRGTAAELLHWKPERGGAVEVVLLDE